MVFYNS